MIAVSIGDVHLNTQAQCLSHCKRDASISISLVFPASPTKNHASRNRLIIKDRHGKIEVMGHGTAHENANLNSQFSDNARLKLTPSASAEPPGHAVHSTLLKSKQTKTLSKSARRCALAKASSGLSPTANS